MPNKLTKEVFIERAKKAHGDKYDYSKVEYVNVTTKVCIICPEHGAFWQTPDGHLCGKGCIKCAHNAARKPKVPLSTFIQRARKKHGDKYDYSRVKYTNLHDHITIICPIHGEFKQTAHHHLLGANCPDCVCVNARRGILGVGNNDILRSKKSQAYFIWRNMINRACDPKIKSKYPTYENCTVCDEWMNFSNFKAWFENPENGYREGYHLDKDIIVKGNKIYSPDTCCFVPHRINVLFVQNNRRRGNLPIGVIKRKSGRYTATVCKDSHNVVLGTFDTICEAFAMYKTEKESFIRETANAYYSRGEITSRVYDAMMNYKVDITD